MSSRFFSVVATVILIQAANSFGQGVIGGNQNGLGAGGYLPKPPVQTPPASNSQSATGLTLAFSTSGYEFTPTLGSNIKPLSSKTVLAAHLQGFNASVALVNHTSQNIGFQFPTPVDARQHFVFRVYDANGTLVWDSSAGVMAPQIVTDATLKAKQAWRSTMFIPLFIDGVPLAAGTYQLKVTLNGTPQFSASTSFVVDPVIAF